MPASTLRLETMTMAVAARIVSLCEGRLVLNVSEDQYLGSASDVWFTIDIGEAEMEANVADAVYLAADQLYRKLREACDDEAHWQFKRLSPGELGAVVQQVDRVVVRGMRMYRMSNVSFDDTPARRAYSFDVLVGMVP